MVVVLALAAPAAWAQPRRTPREEGRPARAPAAAPPTPAEPEPAPPADANRAPLTDAVADGILELLGAQLDRFGDMATTDFALDPLVTEAPETVEPELRGEAPQRTQLPWEPWSSCGLDAVVPVDLRATGGLVPMQVTLASRGSRAVALVTLGRPGGTHRGMIFPESRWVEWDGARTVVSPAPGFAPDAAVVLRDRDAAVFSYTRRGPDGAEIVPTTRDPAPPPPSTLGITRLGARGRPLGAMVVVPHTEGLLIDAPPVTWEGGTAVVLGRPNPPPHEDARSESIWFLDNLGRPLRAPLPLTQEARDDPRGSPCASLAAALNGASLHAAWTVPSGPRAGVWVRRGIHLDAVADPPWDAPRSPRGRPPRRWAEQVLQGAGWTSPVVSPWGVLVRRSARRSEGDAAALTELVLAGAPAPRATPRVLDAFWDPLPAWGRGGLVVLGLGPDDASEAARAWLRWAPHGAAAMRPVTAPHDERDAAGVSGRNPLDALPDAVDYAVAPFAQGALVAWIAPDPDDSTAPRRLALARVECRLGPDDTPRRDP